MSKIVTCLPQYLMRLHTQGPSGNTRERDQKTHFLYCEMSEVRGQLKKPESAFKDP